MKQNTSMTPGESLIAIALSFGLFFAGYIVRGWAIENPFKDVALVVPTSTYYQCQFENGSFSINGGVKR